MVSEQLDCGPWYPYVDHAQLVPRAGPTGVGEPGTRRTPRPPTGMADTRLTGTPDPEVVVGREAALPGHLGIREGGDEDVFEFRFHTANPTRDDAQTHGSSPSQQ